MNIVDLVTIYVTGKFKDLPSCYHFHNIEHTKKVVDAVLEITQQEPISSREREILTVAAWFHDIGFLISPDGHEEHSKKLAQDFLQDLNYPKHIIDKVKACISSTEYCKKPESKLGKIICDADLYHLSQSDYPVWLKKLRNELNVMHNLTFDEIGWLDFNIKFLEQHKYYTDYGKQILAKGKEKNILQLYKQSEKILQNESQNGGQKNTS